MLNTLNIYSLYLLKKKESLVIGRGKHKLGFSLLSVPLWTQRSRHFGNKILV